MDLIVLIPKLALTVVNRVWNIGHNSTSPTDNYQTQYSMLNTHHRLCSFSTKTLFKRYGFQPESMPVLPQITAPVRYYIPGEKQIPKKDIYDMVGYKSKEFPRCRYFAYQHKGQVYHVYDSSLYPFGRMIQRIATTIRGKDTPLYRNNQVNDGQISIVVNAQDPLFNAKKVNTKELIYHTGFVGHLKRYRYKDVLLRRPELLYYYAVNKFLPKNKLRAPYFQNLYVFRGKTHNFPFLPQFAPDKNIYEGLPEVNLLEMARSPEAKVLKESEEGAVSEMLKQNVEKGQYDQFAVEKQKEMIPAIPRSQIQKLQKRYLKKLDRYRRVGVFKNKPKQDDQPVFQYFDSMQKAKRSPHYDLLKIEQVQEDEEQLIKDIYKDVKQPGSKAQEPKGSKTQDKKQEKPQDPKKK